MRIVQIVDVLSFGDAVSNHVRFLDNIGRKINKSFCTYCSYLDNRLDRNIYRNIKEYIPEDDDIILYHLSTGCELNRIILSFGRPIIINFHNITPPEFFDGYNHKIKEVSQKGYDDLRYILSNSKKLLGFINDSNYNGSVLESIGFNCPMYTIPILIDKNEYLNKEPNPKILALGKDGYTNILFVGRIAPNKKQEDIILSFYYYQKYYNQKSRLFLVGNYQHFEKYYLKLKKFSRNLGASNIYFTGQISFDEIVAYYRIANYFLCESEHEGFCVPIVESMIFNVPILAFDSSAVGETLGNGGLLLQDKDPCFVAKLINSLDTNNKIINIMKTFQEERLKELIKPQNGSAFFEAINKLSYNSR